MSKFMNLLEKEIADVNNVSVTENGALGYRTTNVDLLDLNFMVPQMRTANNVSTYTEKWDTAFKNDPVVALRWLFFLRDIRGGIGERKSFRLLLNRVATNQPKVVESLLQSKVEHDGTSEYLIPFYGRWDDVVSLIGSPVQDAVFRIIKYQLKEDCNNLDKDKSVSLLAKWLPSVNTSSKESRGFAKTICKALHMRECDYRRTLSKLRAHIDVIERKMAGKEWDKIDYGKVPSRANMLYSKAFLRHDEERRTKFIESLKKGEVKVNVKDLFPHEIFARLRMTRDESQVTLLEEMWKRLPNIVDPNSNTIVVADGSGSMGSPIPGATQVTALDVSNALAVYFSERLEGPYKDKYITFSRRPRLLDLSGCHGLKEKGDYIWEHDECENTNLEAVFKLILDTAINNHLEQSDLPSNILIVSDMEFDCQCDYSSRRGSKRLMDVIKERYEEAGYKLPRLIYWNINSRSSTIPLTENELGVALVSGYSINIFKMVMSGELDPWLCLLEQLMSDRYDPIETAYKAIVE